EQLGRQVHLPLDDGVVQPVEAARGGGGLEGEDRLVHSPGHAARLGVPMLTNSSADHHRLDHIQVRQPARTSGWWRWWRSSAARPRATSASYLPFLLAAASTLAAVARSASLTSFITASRRISGS